MFFRQTRLSDFWGQQELLELADFGFHDELSWSLDVKGRRLELCSMSAPEYEPTPVDEDRIVFRERIFKYKAFRDNTVSTFTRKDAQWTLGQIKSCILEAEIARADNGWFHGDHCFMEIMFRGRDGVFTSYWGS